MEIADRMRSLACAVADQIGRAYPYEVVDALARWADVFARELRDAADFKLD